MKCPGVLKARNLEELKATNRVTIFITMTRFHWQRVMFLSYWNRETISSSAPRFWRRIWKDFRVLKQSWSDFYYRDAILGAFKLAYLSWSQFQTRGLRFWRARVRFWDLKTARREISSSFTQFMYVLIISLIMLFVNSIMSS